jgi:hypothetical protein
MKDIDRFLSGHAQLSGWISSLQMSPRQITSDSIVHSRAIPGNFRFGANAKQPLHGSHDFYVCLFSAYDVMQSWGNLCCMCYDNPPDTPLRLAVEFRFCNAHAISKSETERKGLYMKTKIWNINILVYHWDSLAISCFSILFPSLLKKKETLISKNNSEEHFY